MARYMENAATANSMIMEILQKISFENEQDEQMVKSHLIRLYNEGIKSNPRPCQATVRERACQRAALGLGFEIEMVKKQNHNGREFNLLKISSPQTSEHTDT